MDTNNIIVVCTVCIVRARRVQLHIREFVHVCNILARTKYKMYVCISIIRASYSTVSMIHHCRNNRVLYSMYSYTPKAPAILLLLTLLPLVCDVIENSWRAPCSWSLFVLSSESPSSSSNFPLLSKILYLFVCFRTLTSSPAIGMGRNSGSLLTY